MSSCFTSRRQVVQRLSAAFVTAASSGFINGSQAPAANQATAATAENQQGTAATRFQLACMTLPWSAFPLQRALEGIRTAGFRYVAWGTTHVETEGGPRVPVMAPDAAPASSRELAQRCRDMGLEPLMMFSTVYPEAPDAVQRLTLRLQQAAAAGIDQVLTFGHTQGGNRKLWVQRLRELGPIARDNGVLLVIKQHGGETGTGQACAEIVREVADGGVAVNYDAGNVMDYLNVDPIPDIRTCADVVRSFCMKDHRNWPIDQDCGPGFGEIDHYRLLQPVAFRGLDMPLCCENIFAPIVARPSSPQEVDQMASQVRVFLETVITGIQSLSIGSAVAP